MAFANAVDAKGVWAPIPLKTEDIMRLHAWQPAPEGTTIFLNDDESVVELWTQGARNTISRFREMLTQFTHQPSSQDNIHVRMGEAAALKALSSML